MRYSCEHKAETRCSLVKAAAREIRLNGPERVAVADVMASAGLTHGGFYAHFESKGALVIEAIDAMFADAQSRNPVFNEAPTNEKPDHRYALRTFLELYISADHRDRPERGCPLPALSADVARSSGPTQARFAVGLEKLTFRIETALVSINYDDPAGEARAVVAQMVGAVALARAVGGGEQSDAILQNTLTSMLDRLGL